MFNWGRNRSEHQKSEPLDTSPDLAGAKQLGSIEFQSPSMRGGITIGGIWVTEKDGVIVHPDTKAVKLLRDFDQKLAATICRDLANEFLHCFNGGDISIAFDGGYCKFKPYLHEGNIVISADEQSAVDYLVTVMSSEHARFVPSN